MSEWKAKQHPDQLTLILFSLWKAGHPDLVLTLKTKSGEAVSVSWVIAIGCSFIVLLIFITS